MMPRFRGGTYLGCSRWLGETEGMRVLKLLPTIAMKFLGLPSWNRSSYFLVDRQHAIYEVFGS